jgi:sugar/nucleoside kinase (ribokinase family)
MSLLVIGSIAFDSVQTPFGQRDNLLGGSASYLSTSASYFGKVQTCGVVGQDFPAAHLDFFASRGVDLAGVERVDGKTIRWRGQYGHDLNVATTLETQLNVFKTFRPTLPESFKQAKYVMLGNIDPEAQLAVIEQLKAPKLVACDTMNYWIGDYNASLRKTLARVDLLSINEAEARQLAETQNLLKAAELIRAMGPKRLVIKRGEYGALLFDEAGVFALPGFPLETVCDPTGAGDTFAGGLMGYIAAKQNDDPITLRRAVVVGSVMASFVVEDFSLDRLRTLDKKSIDARLRSYKDLVHFEVDSAHA